MCGVTPSLAFCKQMSSLWEKTRPRFHKHAPSSHCVKDDEQDVFELQPPKTADQNNKTSNSCGWTPGGETAFICRCYSISIHFKQIGLLLCRSERSRRKGARAISAPNQDNLLNSFEANSSWRYLCCLINICSCPVCLLYPPAQRNGAKQRWDMADIKTPCLLAACRQIECP